MPVFHQNRSSIVRIIFACIFLAIAGQLVHLQLLSPGYKTAADNNAVLRKVVYPDRGIIFDRNRKSLLENRLSNDLTVIPAEARGIDTTAFCALLNIDTAEYKKRMRDLIARNTSVKPGIFEALLSPAVYARLNENLYRFPGFSLVERSVRSYPYHTAAQVLGYIGEVDTAFLRRHAGEGYEQGDYTGMNGLERSYEKILMGQRGVVCYTRDNKNRIQGSYENGLFDTAAVAGRNLYTSIDVEVQQLAEKMLSNKIGSAVAIDPRTGGIIAMVSSPGYDPEMLTGKERRKHFAELLLDTAKPMYNRAIKGQYPPGSTFKPIMGLLALEQGLITPGYGYPCNGAYYNCGFRVRCEHAEAGHAATLQKALAKSCNSYFLQLYRMTLDNPVYGGAEKGYKKWEEYVRSFGLGVKPGIDLPGADMANVPTLAKYNASLRGPVTGCNTLTLAIGQDRLTASPLQMANTMCIIANRGFYYEPHFVDSIENETPEDKGLLGQYRQLKRVTANRQACEAVIEGMYDATQYGTAASIKIPGIDYCAKTGTAQNPHGDNHSWFVCFAPRENPKIAIAVIVENAGFGSRWAGPIAGFIAEKYLNDSIPAARMAEVERIASADLIPAALRNWYRNREKPAAEPGTIFTGANTLVTGITASTFTAAEDQPQRAGAELNSEQLALTGKPKKKKERSGSL